MKNISDIIIVLKIIYVDLDVNNCEMFINKYHIHIKWFVVGLLTCVLYFKIDFFNILHNYQSDKSTPQIKPDYISKQNSDLLSKSNNFSDKYTILNVTYECDSLSKGNYKKGNVYWTVFAGRRNRLQLQV